MTINIRHILLYVYALAIAIALILQKGVLAQYEKGPRGFSCQGKSYDDGLNNCKDNGNQKLSAGGNVTVFLRKANHLPNRDFTGASAKVSDPYVKFIIDGREYKSEAVRDNLDPTFNQYVNLGLQRAATQIRVEIWDEDIGMEFGDDLMVWTTMRVPFCSMFMANGSRLHNHGNCLPGDLKGTGNPDGCYTDDSSWAMPYRKMCNETGVISFVQNKRCSAPDGICLWLDFLIVPYEFSIDLVNRDAIIPQKDPQLTAFGETRTRFYAPWTDSFGQPYLNDDNNILDFRWEGSFPMNGAIMVQMDNDEKVMGRSGEVKFYASVNFPSRVYVCREQWDNEQGIPEWLEDPAEGWNSDFLGVYSLKMQGQSNLLWQCWYKDVAGTAKNLYGGTIDGTLTFRANTVKGRDKNWAQLGSLYRWNYIVLAIPRLLTPFVEVINIFYDATMFIDSLFNYGMMFVWFSYLALRLLRKANFRVDRLKTYLVSRVLTGDEKNIIASLFMSYGKSSSNIEFRSHIFWAENALYFFLAFPFFLILAWGFAITTYIRPVALGFGLVFIGSAAMLFAFGFTLWESNNWLLSPFSLMALVLSVLSFLVYILSIIFIDPAVMVYGHYLNISALSMVFGTLNCIPLFLLIFRQDRTYKHNLSVVIDKFGEAVCMMKQQDPIKNPIRKADMKVNKLIHALLSDAYTINPNVPQFKFGSVLPELPKENKTEITIGDKTIMVDRGDDLYNFSLIILLVYMIIAIGWSEYPSLALLNCLTLILLDSINSALSHGDVQWSPGYKICLLVAGRLIIMGGGENLWLCNYSIAYMVYAGALVQELINSYFPILSNREACNVVFSTKTEIKEPSADISGSPFFCLGYITFAFVAVIFTAAFGGVSDLLPTPPVDVFGTPWDVYAFGVIAIAVTITGGLATCTVRAIYLQKHNLLADWAVKMYMFKETVGVTTTLAIFTEVAIVSSGIVIFGITGSNIILIMAIMLPPIAYTLGHSYGVWVSNDYTLVHWPPVEKNAKNGSGDSPSELDVAFNMIDNIFGQEGEGEGEGEDTALQEKTLKGFKLPALEVTGSKVETQIKMPALPLKSVLRKKRQNLGIKVKQPLVKDLRAREGADADKFGTGSDVLDLNDPWAQFNDEEVVEVKTFKKEAMKFSLEDRGGFMSHPTIVAFKAKLEKNAVYIWLRAKFLVCYEALQKNFKKYEKIYQKSFHGKGDGEEEDEEGENNSNDDEEDDEDEEAKDENKDGKDKDGKKKKKKEGLTEVPPGERLNHMSFWGAVFGGFLTGDEYKALFFFFLGCFLIMIMGIAIADNNAPLYIGHVIWVSILMFIFTFIPVIKYFNTYKVDEQMKQMAYFVAVFHFLFCVCFFGKGLNGDIGIVPSLWILDYFFYFPAFLYMAIEFYKWVDDGFKLEILDKDGDGNVTLAEYIAFFKAYPILLIMMILLVWQMFLWVSLVVGQISTIFLLCGSMGYIFVRDWAVNDFYLSPQLGSVANYVLNFVQFICFAVALLTNGNPTFALSLYFFVAISRCCTQIITKYMASAPDTILYFSPLVFPCYTYNPQTNDIVEETRTLKLILRVLMLLILWGSFLAAFLYPVNVGLTIACFVFLTIGAIIASTMVYLPMKIGLYANVLSPEGIIEAASVAKSKFLERRTPLSSEIPDFDKDMAGNFEPPPKSQLEKQRERQCLDLAVELINDARSLTYTPDDGVEQVKVVLEDEDEQVAPWYIEKWNEFKAAVEKLIDMLPQSMKGYKRHSESLFRPVDAIAEAIITGRGPFGFIGVEGQVYKLFQEAQKHPKLKFLNQPWLNVYDQSGNDKSLVLLSEHLDSIAIINKMPELDQALDHAYKEELRCAVHLLLMIIVAADSKLQRDQVLFQKFLRENRFRLASNGISPPPNIFSSSSFASINIPLTAVWLQSLTTEERERFQLLKSTFSDEQKDRDELVDNADYQLQVEAELLKEERQLREKEMADKLKRSATKRFQERVQAFADTLNPMEKAKFLLKRDIWTTNHSCTVNQNEQELYDRFKAAVFTTVTDEHLEVARIELADLEAAQKDCRMGEYGRPYQFVDSEFQPGDMAIGEAADSAKVLGWRCAPGVAEGVQLFSGGTDPDDISLGVFKTEWIMSALSMLSAAGGVGDGMVDEQILNLYVGHFSLDGELTFATEVGAYCVRLFKQGFWNPIIVDDLLPMRNKEYWTNENRGMACAHSRECNGLWVSLVEKAYAKYYGSYGSIERGFVHHALEDLTGCEAESISLASAARGVGKRSLWDNLIRYVKNQYIIGAGTGTSNLVDKEIQDMGIVFNSAYTIYSIVEIDGYKLLKLRNPPGDHEEWKGDWSDNSTMWSRRLKGKLGLVEADDNTFFMCFDDFCNVFRNIYVCKWYNPKRWGQIIVSGEWRRPEDLQAKQKKEENSDAMLLDDSATRASKEQQEKEERELKKQMERALIDTSGGLPTRHNPACVVENNPQYSIKVFRPTELKFSLLQVDAAGNAKNDPHPAAIYVLDNEHESIPLRAKKMHRDNTIFFTGEAKATRELNLYCSLSPGLYTIVCAPYLAGMEGHFNLKVVYNYKVDFTQIWPPRWFNKVQTKVDEADSAIADAVSTMFKPCKKTFKKFFGNVGGDDDDPEDADADSSSDEDEKVEADA
jgi:hypothetical protein